MSNRFFGNNLSKLDKIKLRELEAQELAQDCREEELAAWKNKNEEEFSENYPLGGMVEPYDIEKEKELCREESI